MDPSASISRPGNFISGLRRVFQLVPRPTNSARVDLGVRLKNLHTFRLIQSSVQEWNGISCAHASPDNQMASCAKVVVSYFKGEETLLERVGGEGCCKKAMSRGQRQDCREQIRGLRKIIRDHFLLCGSRVTIPPYVHSNPAVLCQSAGPIRPFTRLSGSLRWVNRSESTHKTSRQVVAGHGLTISQPGRNGDGSVPIFDELQSAPREGHRDFVIVSTIDGGPYQYAAVDSPNAPLRTR